MFVRLGRWLRAAGYDTVIADERSADADLLARAVRERRLLLTRDAALSASAGTAKRVMVLSATKLDALAAELRQRLGLDWLARPFTRCLVCNARLVRAPAGSLTLVPEQSRTAAGVLRRCPGCGRLYWEGGHVRRMRAQLARWNQGGYF